MCEGRGEFAFFSCRGNPKRKKQGIIASPNTHVITSYTFISKPINPKHRQIRRNHEHSVPEAAANTQTPPAAAHGCAAPSLDRKREQKRIMHKTMYCITSNNQHEKKMWCVFIKKPCAYTPPFTPMLPGDSSYQLVHTQASVQADSMELQSEKQNTHPKKDNCSFSGL